jgi:hypothetical protein
MVTINSFIITTFMRHYTVAACWTVLTWNSMSLLTYLLTELSPSWGAANCTPEGSIPCSQESSTGPYPEPYQSNPHHPILPLKVPFWYCSPTYVLVFPMVSFLLAFPPISYMHSSSPPFVLHAPRISSFLTWSFFAVRTERFGRPRLAVADLNY